MSECLVNLTIFIFGNVFATIALAELVSELDLFIYIIAILFGFLLLSWLLKYCVEDLMSIGTLFFDNGGDKI